MELTPKVFRDVQFREKLRGGYHPEDVDEFLEQAAVAAEALLEQLRQAQDRAQRAEATAADATGTDETLKRMLVIAQRTADQAVKEAKDEAERMLAEARAQAQTILADAEARGRSAYESAITERRAAIETADSALSQAQHDVEALQGWVELHRNHLLGIMRDAQALIENAGLVSEPPPVAPLPAMWANQQRPAIAAAPAEQPAERDAGHREGDTGEWDPRFLEDLGDRQPGGPQGAHAGAGVPGGPPGAGYSPWHSAGTPDQGEVGEQTLSGEPGPGFEGQAGPQGPVGQHMSGDNTLAFDERALDNFFSEQDMGDGRGGMGRFRRRQ
jgi:DivIVA domain-containing protein